MATAGDQLGPDAVAVDGRRRERVDRVLVEVARDDDPGVVCAEPVLQVMSADLPNENRWPGWATAAASLVA